MESKKSLAALIEDSTSLSPSFPRVTSTPLSRTPSTQHGRDTRNDHAAFLAAAHLRDPTSCVSRETSDDDCAYHRLIVWAAVKRNSSRRLTESQKLECPLLRCRKQFSNHESMLRHLAGCEHLPAGEYWCYDCKKAERFNDGKCKDCLGHPSKRRKMMSMAKSFFSSIGHKPRKSRSGRNVQDQGDDVLLAPPPSYDSLLPPEAHSTEIMEIDSIPIAPPPPPPSRPIPENLTIDPRSLPLPVPELDIPELESSALAVDPIEPWDATTELDRCSASRPMLQVNTQDLGHYRRVPRHKVLAPSSSVRSTTSTASNTSTTSTTSTATTSSTASSNISPISAWSASSHGWSSSIDTTLTSPRVPMCHDAFKANPLPDTKKMTELSYPADILNDLFELPAEPVQPSLSKTTSELMDCDDLLFSFEPTSATNLPPVMETNMTFTTDTSNEMDLTRASFEEFNSFLDANTLVSSAWDAIQEHVSSSVAKVHHLSGNPLADKLRNETASSVAATGLRTLRDLISGQVPVYPHDTLCCVHLVYALSLVVYGQEASSRAGNLFLQALSYANHFAEHHLYAEVVMAIWQPTDLSQLSSGSQSRAPLSRTSSTKGKEVVSGPSKQENPDKSNCLLLTARTFLDELEIATVVTPTIDQPTDISTSGLWMKHLEDFTLETDLSSPFTLAVGSVLSTLMHKFWDSNSLAAALRVVQARVDAGTIGSCRRVELETLHAGRMSLPPSTYYNDFVPQVWHACAQVYQQRPYGISQRLQYYGHSISLVESMIIELSSSDQVLDACVPENENDDDLDEFINSLAAYDDGATNQDLDTTALLGIPSDDFLLDPSSLTSAHASSSLQPGTPPTASCSSATSPLKQLPALTSSQDTPDTQAQKMEASNCCEICGYRPKGAPQWFKGSMAKHKKLQHSTSPPKIYRCPFPGCNSAYKNRPDNLRQHQLDKEHFVDEDGIERRPSKRKRAAAE